MKILFKDNKIVQISTENPESLDILHTRCFRKGKGKVKCKIRDKPL